ncbi:unnamed protein product [Calicophoron daubneyi]|uniref:Uncharacterized protein n=1 Tax=Calicophoron daubneyi TaxID=300641 RepID=A0AAV2T7M3_CALDB
MTRLFFQLGDRKRQLLWDIGRPAPVYVNLKMSEGDSKAILKDVTKFDKKGLQHVETKEKIVLPSKDAIDQEKTEKQLLEEITKQPHLKHTETKEKNPLPTKEDIEAEKKAAK